MKKIQSDVDRAEFNEIQIVGLTVDLTVDLTVAEVHAKYVSGGAVEIDSDIADLSTNFALRTVISDFVLDGDNSDSLTDSLYRSIGCSSFARKLDFKQCSFVSIVE